MAFDQSQYVKNYTKDNYDKLTIIVPKNKGDAIKEYAKEHGKSMSKVVIEALEAHCNLDLSK